MKHLLILAFILAALVQAAPTPTPTPVKVPTISYVAEFICFRPGGKVVCAPGRLSNAKLDGIIKDSLILCAKDSDYVCARISYLAADADRVQQALKELGATTDGASK